MRFGRFDLTPLSDGFFRLDGGAMFGVVPKPLWEKRAPPDARNRIRLGLRPLLIQTGSHNILVDSGVGAKMRPKDVEIYAIDREPPLERALAGVGLTVHDIDLVIASHLHFDHAGGFTTPIDGTIRPTFPRARYIVRRGEWEDATHPHERNRASYFAENFQPLADAGVLELVDGDEEIVPGVRVRRSGGHTMHHQIVLVEDGGRRATFVGDLIPTTAHVDEPWIMGYDLYPMDTLAAKKAFLPEAIAGEYVIFFEHDPAVPAGVIRADQGRKFVEPVPLDA